MERLVTGTPSLRAPGTSDELAEEILGPVPEPRSTVTARTAVAPDDVRNAVQAWRERRPNMPPHDLLATVAPEAALVVETYNEQTQALDDAVDALASAEGRVRGARNQDRAALTEALDHGTKPPKLLASMDAAERAVAEAMLVVEARLDLAQRADRAAAEAVRLAALQLHAFVVAAIEKLGVEGLHHLNALRAALDERDTALVDLDLIDRRFLARAVDVSRAVDRADTPRLTGRIVGEILTGGGAELRSAHMRTDFHPVEVYLATTPDNALLTEADLVPIGPAINTEVGADQN